MDLYTKIKLNSDKNTLDELKAANNSLVRLHEALSKKEGKKPLDWLRFLNMTKRTLFLVLSDIDELKDELFMENKVDD